MRDLFVILGSLLIAVLVAAFAVPRFIDWAPYKNEIEARLAAATGLKVTLAGPLRVTLLPKVALNAQDVVIEGPEATVTVARLRAQMSFASLLGGTPHVTGAELLGAVVKLGDAAASDPASALARLLSSAGPPLQIDSVTLDTVAVTAADGTELATITRGNAALEQRQGPLRLDLDGALAGVPGKLRLGVGPSGADRRRHVSLALDADAGPRGLYHMLLDAEAAPGKVLPGKLASIALDGNIAVTQARHRASAAGNSENKDVGQWRAQAKLHAERNVLSFTDLDISRERAAALRFAGTGALDLSGPPALSLKLSARRLVLDPLIGGSDRGAPSAPGGIGPAVTALAAALDGAVPQGLKVTFDIGAEAAELAGESFETLRAQGTARATGIALSELAANWVGRGRVDFTQPTVPSNAIALSGHVSVTSPDAAAFLQGLGLASNGGKTAVPLDLTGELSRTADATRLAGLDIALAGSHVTGDMTVTDARAGQATRVDAHLASADLDLDAWPLGAVTDIVPASVEGSLALHVERLRAGHGTGEAGRLDMAVSQAGSLTRIDNLQLRGFQGLAVTGAGTIGGEGTSFTVHVVAPKVAPLAALSRLVLPRRAVETLATRGAAIEPLAMDLKGRRGAAGQSVDLTLAGSAGATRIDAHGVLGADLAPTSGDATLSAPDAAALLAQIGLPVAAGPALGAGEIKIAATPADGGRLKVTARLAAGGLSASGDGWLSLAGPLSGQGGFSFAAQSTAIAARLAGWALPRVDTEQRADVAGGWTLTPARLALDRLNGHLAGGAFTGALDLALAGEAKLTGELHLPTLSVTAIASLALGDLRGKPGSPWASANFPTYAAPPMPISIDVSAPVADLGGVAGRNAKATVDIGPQGIAIANAAADVAGGVLGGEWRIQRDGGLARSVLRLSAAAVQAGDILPDTGLAGSLSGRLEISGAGETLSRILASLGGGGTLHVADATIAAAELGGLRRAFARAITDETLLDKGRLAALVAAETAKGPLQGIAFEAPLLVTSGVIRTTVARLDVSPGDAVEGAATIDLKALTLDARLGLSTLSPGDPDKRVPLASVILWKGPLFSPKRSADVAALLQAVSVERLRLELERIELLEFDQREQGFFNRRLKAGRQKAEPLRELTPPAPPPDPLKPVPEPQATPPAAAPPAATPTAPLPAGKPDEAPAPAAPVPEAPTQPQPAPAKPQGDAPAAQPVPAKPEESPPVSVPDAAPPTPPVKPDLAPLPAPIEVPAPPRVAPQPRRPPTVLHPGN